MIVRIKYTVLLLALIGLSINSRANTLEIKFPPVLVKNINHTITIQNKLDLNEGDSLTIFINEIPHVATIIDSEINLTYKFDHKGKYEFKINDDVVQEEINPIPLWFSVLPPLIAILIALIFKEVFTALFVGILIGTTTIFSFQGLNIFTSLFKGVFSVVDTYVLQSLNDSGHLSIIIFSMLIGAMVNIITKNGGMKGVVNILSKYANNPSSGQFVTWLMGIAIFFDDYANTLVVGNTMRPMTDKLRISREKLAYIVDSTAAPIAAIAFVTTWIGAELSYIEDGINTIGLDESPYSIFFNSLKYSFYPILALLFIVILIVKKSDFGPMVKAELNARKFGILESNNNSFSNNINDLDVDENIKARWYNAAIPVLIIILGTFAGLFYTGFDSEVWNSSVSFATKLSTIIGNADSYSALLWSSSMGVLAAVLLTITQRILSLKDTVESMVNGFRTMLTAILILTLAWSIALLTKHLHTADFISQILVEINMSPYLVPATTFILAALVSFSTGSSWGTMAILYPLILPATWLITQKYGMDYDASLAIFYNVVSAVLSGSVLGDHCSPISDTTILSSLASSCNHIEHVRTQLPYALTVGGVSILLGTIPAAYGVPSIILFAANLIILYLIVHYFSTKTA